MMDHVSIFLARLRIKIASCEMRNALHFFYLPQNIDADTNKNYEDAGYSDHCKHPVVQNTNF